MGVAVLMPVVMAIVMAAETTIETTVETAPETIEEFLRNFLVQITTLSREDLAPIFQGILAVLLAYGFLLTIQGVATNLSEKVPRRRRLLIKQSVPFLKGLVLLGTGLYLMRLFVAITQSDFSGLAVTLLVGLGFAFKDYVSSIVAGIVNLIEGPFRMGDRVQIGEHYGEVVDYGLRGLQLQTPDDNAVTIPHSSTWTEPISNANSGQLEAQVVTTFYFAHEADISLAVDILYQAAYSSRYTQLKLPVVVIAVEERWATRLQLKSYPMDARNEYVYKTDLVLRIKEACVRQQLPYPQMPTVQEPVQELNENESSS
ncbi:MAG: mechanosensitive ion channel family protein [Cyanobacteria bacterium P01_F01_bin.53]